MARFLFCKFVLQNIDRKSRVLVEPSILLGLRKVFFMVQVLSQHQFVFGFYDLNKREQAALSLVYDYQSKRAKDGGWVPVKDLVSARGRPKVVKKLLAGLVKNGFLQTSLSRPNGSSFKSIRYKIPESVGIPVITGVEVIAEVNALGTKK